MQGQRPSCLTVGLLGAKDAVEGGTGARTRQAGAHKRSSLVDAGGRGGERWARNQEAAGVAEACLGSQIRESESVSPGTDT